MSSSIDQFSDNPWEDAAANDSWSKSGGLNNLKSNDENGRNVLNTTGRNTELIFTDTTTSNNNISYLDDSTTFDDDIYIDVPPTKRCIGFVVSVWNILDGSFGFLYLLYGLILLIQQQEYNHHHHPSSSSSNDDNINNSTNSTNSSITSSSSSSSSSIITGDDWKVELQMPLEIIESIMINNSTNTDNTDDSVGNNDNISMFSIFIFFIGSVYLLRCIVVQLSIGENSDALLNRIGLRISALTSPMMAMILLIIAIWVSVSPDSIRHYLQKHDIDHTQGHLHHIFWLLHIWYEYILTDKNYFLVALAMVIFSVLEFIRWQLLLDYRIKYLRYDHYISIHPSLQQRLLSSSSQQQQTSERPWWFSSSRSQRTNLEQDMHISMTRTKSSWFPFSLFSSRQDDDQDNNNTVDVRDDSSAGFASVQDDWASRSQEDPVWWSRDDNEGGNNNLGGQNADTTWAN